MNAGVNLTGIIQPSPDMIYDQNYEEGETLLPKEAGKWTLFSIQPIFTKDDATLPIVREYSPGHPVPTAVQATWLAADTEAYKLTVGRFLEQEKQRQRAAAAQAAKPKIVIPQ